MSKPIPSPVSIKTSTQNNEVATATSISDISRFYQTRKFRVSRNSPPATVDVNELELVFDKNTLKLWTKIDGTLRYVQFT